MGRCCGHGSCSVSDPQMGYRAGLIRCGRFARFDKSLLSEPGQGTQLGSDHDYRKEMRSSEFGRSCSDHNSLSWLAHYPRSQKHRTPSGAQLPQALRTTIYSIQPQGHRANSPIASNKPGSVGPLRGPQALRFPCFEAPTDERKTRCGASGCLTS